MNTTLSRAALGATLFAATALSAHGAEVQWNGFLDLTYTLHDSTDESAGPPGEDESETQSKFGAMGELDINAALGNKVSARLDVDYVGSDSTGNGNSTPVEQVFIKWDTPQNLVVKGGVFNNPLGWEAEDAPDKYHVTSGLLYMIWDDATSLYGNNVAGASLSGSFGQVSLTGALLNDLGNVNEKNSFMAVVNFAPAKGVDIEAGFVTQDAGYETIVDINASWTQGIYMVGGEIMLPSELIDMGLGATGMIKLNDQLSGALRFENVSYDVAGADDTRSLTFGMSYMLEKNLFANGEIRMIDDEDEDVDGDVITLELVATF